jgi:hypothetical protein
MATLHTATTARPCKPATTIRATHEQIQGMAQEIGRNVRQAVNQSLIDSASKQDAEKREVVRERYGAVVANGLAGKALDTLYRKITAGAPTTNAQEAGAPDPATYFGNASSQPLTADASNLPKE